MLVNTQLKFRYLQTKPHLQRDSGNMKNAYVILEALARREPKGRLKKKINFHTPRRPIVLTARMEVDTRISFKPA